MEGILMYELMLAIAMICKTDDNHYGTSAQQSEQRKCASEILDCLQKEDIYSIAEAYKPGRLAKCAGIKK